MTVKSTPEKPKEEPKEQPKEVPIEIEDIEKPKKKKKGKKSKRGEEHDEEHPFPHGYYGNDQFYSYDYPLYPPTTGLPQFGPPALPSPYIPNTGVGYYMPPPHMSVPYYGLPPPRSSPVYHGMPGLPPPPPPPPHMAPMYRGMPGLLPPYMGVPQNGLSGTAPGNQMNTILLISILANMIKMNAAITSRLNSSPSPTATRYIPMPNPTMSMMNHPMQQQSNFGGSQSNAISSRMSPSTGQIDNQLMSALNQLSSTVGGMGSLDGILQNLVGR